MPSNVRRYEKSCKTQHRYGDQFYQCSTCDEKLQLYFCGQCYNNGQHIGHTLKSISNRYDIYFCNCGDITGLICCSVHPRKIINSADKPLHVNESGLDQFISTYNCEKRFLTKLSRVNQIRKLDIRSNDYAMIKRYFENSNPHSRSIRLGQVWSFYRKDRELAFVEKRFDQQLRILLWHGTKKENLVKILQKGLQRPYVELGRNSNNGSMFGKGVYFADRVSKSTQYSDSNGSGLLFLCEVALGRMYKVGTSESFERVPERHDSIRGVGRNIPDPDGDLTFDQGIVVPCGITISNPSPSVPTTLFYNEYIVFNPARVLIKFIVQFENIDNSFFGQFSSTTTSQPLILPANRNTSRPLTNPRPFNSLRPLSASSQSSSQQSFRTNTQTSRQLNQQPYRSISQTGGVSNQRQRSNNNNSCILL